MIIAAVILNEMYSIMSMFGADNSSVSRPNLVRLLNDVKHYCESVNTMKFPPEWENTIQELSKKGTANSPRSPTAKKSRVTSPLASSRDVDSDVTASRKAQSAKARDEASDKEDSEKEDSEEEVHETRTVQIEIRGNTGGFVGSTIEFDVVVTHEDGSPVKVHASDFGVEIHGPAAGSHVTISAKGKEEDGAFRIEFNPTEPGANTLSIFMHNTLLTGGVRSIISKAGETAFLIHAKDIIRGQLQGISVVPVVSKALSRSEALKQKLDNIATALEILEALRTRTLTQMENATSATNVT